MAAARVRQRPGAHHPEREGNVLWEGLQSLKHRRRTFFWENFGLRELSMLEELEGFVSNVSSGHDRLKPWLFSCSEFFQNCAKMCHLKMQSVWQLSSWPLMFRLGSRRPWMWGSCGTSLGKIGMCSEIPASHNFCSGRQSLAVSAPAPGRPSTVSSAARRSPWPLSPTNTSAHSGYRHANCCSLHFLSSATRLHDSGPARPSTVSSEGRASLLALTRWTSGAPAVGRYPACYPPPPGRWLQPT